jgi:hypothetical protein
MEPDHFGVLNRHTVVSGKRELDDFDSIVIPNGRCDGLYLHHSERLDHARDQLAESLLAPVDACERQEGGDRDDEVVGQQVLRRRVVAGCVERVVLLDEIDLLSSGVIVLPPGP